MTRRLGTDIEPRHHERGNPHADAEQCQQQLSAARGNMRHLKTSSLQTAAYHRSSE